MSYVIVPIHGTWATNARWTQPDSEFCRQISDFLGAVVVRPFRWSGHNWHRARTKAARQLGLFISDLSVEFPGSRIVLIGHSHGGNVALSALYDAEARARVSCLITLSTPFWGLQIRPQISPLLRRLPEVLGFTIFFALWFALALKFGFNVSLGSLLGGKVEVNDIVSFLVFLATGMLGGCVALVIKRLLGVGKRIASELAVRPSEAIDLLIIRSGGDEASAALATAQFSAWILRKLWQSCTFLASSAAGFYDRHGPLVSVRRFLVANAVVLTITLWIAWSEIAITPESVIYMLLGAPLASFALLYFFGAGLFVVEVALLCVSLVLQPVLALLLMPFGLDLGLVSLVADVSVEAAPPGVWPVFQCQSSAAGKPQTSVFGLFHSSTHDQQEVITFICEWVRSRAQLSKVARAQA